MRRARRLAFGVAVGVWIVAVGAANARAQDPMRPSRTVGLPPPPRQDGPWTPPDSTLPATVVEAARVLFEQGLADPRGCAYREVRLAGAAEDIEGFGKPPARPTHAWVIPFDATGGPRYAVAWNGLVYPVARLGPAADLDEDIRVLTSPEDRLARIGPGTPRTFYFSRDPMHTGRSSGHLETASHEDLTPMKVVILLRLGRADLAERLWRARPNWQESLTRRGQDGTPDLYANLAGDWAWALIDRAGSAHARGDDALALASVREAVRIKPLIDARIADRVPPARPGTRELFCSQIPRLIADLERRAGESSRKPALGRGFPDRAARIAALIRDLELVRGPLVMQGHDVTRDPIVAALIQEGDAAVEPLLACLEHDRRLTRTVETARDHHSTSFGDGRLIEIFGVDHAAYLSLCRILGTYDLGPPRRTDAAGFYQAPTVAEVVAWIRQYWRRTRKVSREEGLFRTLAEGTSDAEWLGTAEILVESEEAHDWAGSLRARANPSLAELLARRCRQIDPPGGPPGSVRDGNRLAGYLAAWDPTAALPVLKDRVGRSIEVLANHDPRFRADEELPSDIARFTMLRARAGDDAALDEYADWIRTIRPPDHGPFATRVFEPLWTHPDRPSIAAATRALFDDPGSPWVPLMTPDDPGWGDHRHRSDLIVSPMLAVPTFRRRVLAGLADDRPSGAVRCGADGRATIEISPFLSQKPSFHPDDPHRPRPGTVMPLRVRDKYAWMLQQVWGFPRFELYWPRDVRDRTIAEMVDMMSRHGERLGGFDVRRLIGDDLRDTRWACPRAVLAFPPLDRPATAEDVAAGRAIFAAGPGTEARTWALPGRPILARWRSQPIPVDEMSLRPYDDRPRERAAMIRSLQWGVVWQAEEVREDGEWRRHYGFVGHHVIARVPAEQIEFPEYPGRSGPRWSEVSRDLDARLVPPGGREDGRLIRPGPVRAGAPLPIVVLMRNRRGLAAAVPIDWVRDNSGVSVLREGVAIRVFHLSDPAGPEPVAGMSGGPAQPASWREIHPRREPGRYRSAAARMLEPTESVEVMRFDLRELFDLGRPGQYRVEVAFADMRTEEGVPAHVSGWFELGYPGDSASP